MKAEKLPQLYLSYRHHCVQIELLDHFQLELVCVCEIENVIMSADEYARQNPISKQIIILALALRRILQINHCPL